MNASLLAAVEMAPRDPILGVTEAYNADKNPNKVNLGVGVYYDDDGKVPLLECVRRAEQMLAERLQPTQLPADRRPAGLRQGGAGAGVRRRQRGGEGKAASSRCRRWAAPAGSRSAPISCAGSTPARKSGSAIRAGKTTARCSRAPASRSTPTPTTTPRRTASISTACSARSRRCPPGRSCAARLLPQPDRRRPLARAVAAGHRSGQCARPGAVPRHRLSGLRRRPRRRRGAGAPVRRGVPGLFVVELVLQVVLALRRARRRAQRGRRERGRGGARAVPAQAPGAHQLLQPADARRPDRGHRC